MISNKCFICNKKHFISARNELFYEEKYYFNEILNENLNEIIYLSLFKLSCFFLKGKSFLYKII